MKARCNNFLIDKEIPVSAGLAAGLADAAATLRGLNRLFDIGASLEELALLGSKIGDIFRFVFIIKLHYVLEEEKSIGSRTFSLGDSS